MKRLITNWAVFIAALLASPALYATNGKKAANLEPNEFIQAWGRIGHIDWIGDDLFRHVVWAAAFILVYLVKLTLEEKYDWKKDGVEYAIVPISWLVTYGIALFELPMVIPALGLGGIAGALLKKQGIVESWSDLKFWEKGEKEKEEKKAPSRTKTPTKAQKAAPKNSVTCPHNRCGKPNPQRYKFCQKCNKPLQPPQGKAKERRPVNKNKRGWSR